MPPFRRDMSRRQRHYMLPPLPPLLPLRFDAAFAACFSFFRRCFTPCFGSADAIFHYYFRPATLLIFRHYSLRFCCHYYYFRAFRPAQPVSFHYCAAIIFACLPLMPPDIDIITAN
jgi:hypothetical protein